MDIDLTTLRLFLAVARKGNISQAAEDAHIAASAVSRRIAELEDHIGTPLFVRKARGVDLTATGRLLAERAGPLLHQANDLVALLKAQSGDVRGELFVAASSSAFLGPFPEVVRQFRDDFPKVAFSVEEVYSREALRAVSSGDAEIGLMAGTSHTGSLVVHSLWPDPIWVVGAPGHPLLARAEDTRPRAPVSEDAMATWTPPPVTFREASAYDVVVLHEGGVLDEVIRHATDREGLVLHRALKVHRASSLCALVQAGLGVGFVRESSARPYFRPGLLSGAPLADSWAQIGLQAVHRSGQPLSKAAETFLDRLTAAAQRWTEG